MTDQERGVGRVRQIYASWALAILCAGLSGCPAESVDADEFAADAGQTVDAPGTLSDAEASGDAAAGLDAGPDSGLKDGSAALDSGAADSGGATGDTTGGGADTGPADAGPADAGPADAGPADAGSQDTNAGPKPWAVAIRAGAHVTCAMLGSGQLACWGRNAHGEVGNGGAGGDKVKSPALVIGLQGVTEVAAGSNHVCALHGGGKVSCWGDNFHAQLGKGTKHDAHASPVLTKLSVAATHIGGSVDAMTATGAGKVWGWGNNLGDKHLSSSNTSQPTPSEVKHASLTGQIKQICNGESFSCALGADDVVRCWGGSDWGEVGHGAVGSTTKPMLPKPVVGLPKVAGITCGSWHGCAWAVTGKAWCWGKNLSGELGNGGKKNVALGTPVSGLKDVIHMAAGRNHTCAALTSGEVRCWGSNSEMQVADTTSTTSLLTPQKVAFAGKATAVAAGSRHSCLLSDKGEVHCWGYNANGQLGDGSLTQTGKPVHAKPPP